MNAQAQNQVWIEQNQQYLVSRWRAVQERMASADQLEEDISFADSDAIAEGMERPPALITLAQIFSLTEFEQFILLLCAGYEMDRSFTQYIKASPQAAPTFELAFNLAKNSHWSATTPAGPLRYWRLIEVKQDDNLIGSLLQMDERIVHYLSGLSYLDSRLTGLLEPCNQAPALEPSLEYCAEQLVVSWTVQDRCGQPLLVQLCGSQAADMFAVACSACERLNLKPYRLSAESIPQNHAERQALKVLWQRDALLDHSALIIAAQGTEQRLVSGLVGDLATPCIVISQRPLQLDSASAVRIDLPRPDSGEQLALWRSALGEAAEYVNVGLEKIVSQFRLPAQDIVSLSQQALSQDKKDEIEQMLWQQCRIRSRRQLESLAQRIESSHQWSDLILPDAQKETLHDIVSYACYRHRVYGDWKFGAKSKRGQGGSCLFYGPSGTGKTMAASVIANELQLDLYQVDLSQIINKYIGETEKNIARIFDMAENSGAILLFDEADSLFSKRTEVRTSNDRNANVGTSYLLQRMESYSGLAILTTNLKKEMDSAFMRRIRFATQFPFPDALTRKQIWARMFPDQIPLDGIDLAKLANLDLAGGNIRNIALNAAFYAAEQGNQISMAHLAKAARREYSKLEKPIRENELRSWA